MSIAPRSVRASCGRGDDVPGTRGCLRAGRGAASRLGLWIVRCWIVAAAVGPALPGGEAPQPAAEPTTIAAELARLGRDGAAYQVDLAEVRIGTTGVALVPHFDEIFFNADPRARLLAQRILLVSTFDKGHGEAYALALARYAQDRLRELPGALYALTFLNFFDGPGVSPANCAGFYQDKSNIPYVAAYLWDDSGHINVIGSFNHEKGTFDPEPVPTCVLAARILIRLIPDDSFARAEDYPYGHAMVERARVWVTGHCDAQVAELRRHIGERHPDPPVPGE